jgi:hypothetical protein
MEYQVPQFIEVEDKIFGPLSLKQFIYLAGGLGLCAIILLSLPFFIGILLAIPVALLSGALAFYKINNKNFVDMVEAAVTFYTKERLFLWKKEPKADAPAVQASVAPPPEKRGLTRGKLRELAWSLDIKDRPGMGQDQ